MAKLEWNKLGERYFEIGVDRGVVYLPGRPGAPWNGLVSISEGSSGGEVTPQYIDGYKFYHLTTQEEFQGTITAFTYPEEFAECAGSVEAYNGLIVTRQKKKEFNLSYRTKIGNDWSGVNLGYKIHLVYNCIVLPSSFVNDTIDDNIEPILFSWDIQTRPPLNATRFNPTTHFVIDSRKTPNEILIALESILYGTEENDPRCPSVFELISIFRDFQQSYVDAGVIWEPYTSTLDGGVIPASQDDGTIDAGPLSEG